MKSQTLNLNKKYQRSNNNNHSKLRSVFLMTTTFIIMLVAISSGVSYRVAITEEINNNSRLAADKDSETKLLRREIAYLKIQQEELSSWKNIKKKIAEFKLPLKQARYGQIVIIDSKKNSTIHEPSSIASTSSGSSPNRF